MQNKSISRFLAKLYISLKMKAGTDIFLILNHVQLFSGTMFRKKFPHNQYCKTISADIENEMNS